ncbi:NUC173 domain-containing protein [Phanerochaete sordida]|uniref:NUC173 domain-containing protein n=1 Tax=Phanerochaete sordida TaxID=48140 RepID=A0A9P3GIZ6_9APHY|nr:NUC173 domain-containing protein [Phanerochaete sordida]
MADGLEQALSKIRPHTSSSLPHQKAPATLLKALESTFREQNTDKTATAYFAALLTTLDGTLQASRAAGPALGDGDVLPAELYLLALVAPFVPHPVIRSNLNTIINLSAPLFPALVPHAPPLRSQLTFYAAVFATLERPQLETPGLRNAFNSILHLCLDPRPKVRKKAAEIVKDVLANPPPPMLRHPYAERTAEWVNASLGDLTGGLPKFKGKKTDSDGTDTAIHLLAFLRPVLAHLPSSTLPAISSALLTLPRLGNPYLSQAAYSILADLLSIPVDDPTNNVHSQVQDILQVVLSSSPSKTDATLIPSWTNLLGTAMHAYHDADPDACASKIWEAWKALWSFMDASDSNVRKSAAQALDLLVKCFTPAFIQAAVKERNADDAKSPLSRIISQTGKALGALTYARALPEVMAVIASLLSGLRFRPKSNGPTAAEILLMPIVVKIAELRVQKSFEFKEAADNTLRTAMQVLGPEVMLRELPLNLEPEDRKAGKEPRAFLLPMLSQPHPSPLSHFAAYFVPLTERMFDLQSTAESEGRQSEAKVWSVLVDQIWSGLHGYCYGTSDLKTALTAQFSQLLSQLLYTQPELRPAVLKALKAMVDSNVALASGDEVLLIKLPEAARAAPISQSAAQENLAFLRTQVESWLAVLFNVFSSVGRDSQGPVGDVISTWLAIAEGKDIAKAYYKLVALLKQNLSTKSAAPQAASGSKDPDNVVAMTLDLLVLMLPYLPANEAQALFDNCLSQAILESSDNAAQKRGYKILTKLVESGKVTVDAQATLEKLDTFLDGLSSAAKKDRFTLLSQLVAKIPPNNLHLIPSIIPEAVLGTKEPSEKARLAAFDLVVAMGRKMSEGGVVRRDQVGEMDEGVAQEATASIEEYMTMIAGGLAGASPHMISATVTAISRLVFEFKDAISPQMHSEILTTLLVFVTSNNREIVKSALGYIKLAIHTMPVDLLQPHLKQLVPALLHWSHDHKNHFKAKVRHIFERMLRRFGWEDVYSCAGEEDDARKVLVNIKKRKDRAKRKKAQNAENENEEDEEEPSAKPAAGDAFEDVLYGSESELDDSDDEDAPAQPAKGRKNQAGGARIRADDDLPMDLLSGAASGITNAAGKKRRRPGQDAARFKTDEDTGKMVIDDEDGTGAEQDAEMEEDVAGVAYREALTSADGFTRGPNGRVKFNKDTKKRRREETEMEDVEMADAQPASNKKEKKKHDARIGQEFKAKKAGGDVKKGGVDPYAYMSLGQAAKKKGRRERLGIAGKR